MTLQEAVEAPRVWTEDAQLELEKGFPDMLGLKAALEAFEHPVTVVEKVAGGIERGAGRRRGLASRGGLLSAVAEWHILLLHGARCAIGSACVRPPVAGDQPLAFHERTSSSGSRHLANDMRPCHISSRQRAAEAIALASVLLDFGQSRVQTGWRMLVSACILPANGHI